MCLCRLFHHCSIHHLSCLLCRLRHHLHYLRHRPEDAGAVQAARRLLDAGYLSVRPLKGGYEAWLAAGQALAD